MLGVLLAILGHLAWLLFKLVVILMVIFGLYLMCTK